ncbi:MAG TPA: type III-B CRISPR module RAMP protein Cmr4 [Candidatus Fraserbacteria bacterium]|nr:type III-B CRISPR module RAMP protein Cmr4 [Candidatus Fraserbacteria bacterium]
MSDLFRTCRVLLLTLDPVHIGTGGYRLGRVDNSIVREPGTKLPKIPGTSLSGAIRTYAAYRYESPDCAGQGNESKATDYKGHCGEKDCPICYTFGSLKTQTDNDKQQAHAGVVNLFDAHILFFPVYSLAGPVWVSTYQRLRDWKVLQSKTDRFHLEDKHFATSLQNWDKPLNLGWIMLEKAEQTEMPALEIPFREENQENRKAWQAIQDQLVLVTDKVFTQVVNSNLEVRTSVAIDPTTGAAQEGALFTYEAIPRATWLVMDVVEDDYRWERDQEGKPKLENGKLKTAFPVTKESKIRKKPLNWDDPLKVVRAGLKLIEVLGVGGMGTRGFGRVRMITDWSVGDEGASNG